ncbi:MAG: hypothetical protein M1828_002954 [Chrysothrix sp. TS-e1954]|nr:MAG: hypothetical protein M1828_002954 [Chrysothrix sp. TS-e1954]
MATKPRKASQVFSDDGCKKARGRPRLDPQDETAADRRRTQIRLAQRAYRQRKEITTTALKRRTIELNVLLNDMHSETVKLSRHAQSAALMHSHPSLATELNCMVGGFSGLVEKANGKTEAVLDDAENLKRDYDNSRSPSNEERPSKPSIKTSQKRKRKLRSKMESDENVEQTLMTPSVLGSVEQPPASMLGYQMVWDDAEVQMITSNPDISTNANDAFGMPSQLDSESPTSLWRFNAGSEDGQISQSSLTSASSMSPKALCSLRPPLSYSCKEATFARRLHRATLEKALHLIGDEMLRPEIFRKKFQLCLPYGDSGQIFNKISDTLRRATGETLEWLDHPVPHLGGAGTHYIKFRESGDAQPSTLRVRSIGAQTLATLMSVTDGSSTQGRSLDMTGFEGEWYDPEDVQTYLAEKGIQFDPQAVIAELDLPHGPCRRSSPKRRRSLQNTLDFLPLNTSNDRTFASPPTSELQKNIRSRQSASPLNAWDFPGSLSHSRTAQPDSSASAVVQSLSSREFVEPQRLTINVDKFVVELVKRATCIGRSPGYRRRDIDRAFNIAVASH